MMAHYQGVTITMDGTRYFAKWFVEDDILTVFADGLGRASTQIRGLSEDWLAKDLLRKLVREKDAA